MKTTISHVNHIPNAARHSPAEIRNRSARESRPLRSTRCLPRQLRRAFDRHHRVPQRICGHPRQFRHLRHQLGWPQQRFHRVPQQRFHRPQQQWQRGFPQQQFCELPPSFHVFQLLQPQQRFGQLQQRLQPFLFFQRFLPQLRRQLFREFFLP